jgi:hypothetical protein
MCITLGRIRDKPDYHAVPLLYQRRRCAKGDSVEIKEMAPEDRCSRDMLVITRWQNRNVAVPLSQLKPIGVDESTTQAIEDWHTGLHKGTASDLSPLPKTRQSSGRSPALKA